MNPLSAVIRVPMEMHGEHTANLKKGGKRKEPSSLQVVKRAGVCGEPAATISPNGFYSARTQRMQSLLRGEQRAANHSLPAPATYLLYLLATPGPSSKRLIMVSCANTVKKTPLEAWTKRVRVTKRTRHWTPPRTTSCLAPPTWQRPGRRQSSSGLYRIIQRLCSQFPLA